MIFGPTRPLRVAMRGCDYVAGVTKALRNDKSKVVVAEVPFETTSPTVDSQVVQIRNPNPDIFLNFAIPKFAAQAIKKIGEIKWTPVQIVTNVSAQVSSVLKPAGLEHSQGIISAAFMKDPDDPRWKDDPGMNEWRSFMQKWYPGGDAADSSNIHAYAAAQGLVQVLKQCGDDLTRANVMK